FAEFTILLFVSLLLLANTGPVEAASLTFGNTVTGSLSLPGQQDSYTCAATVGQWLYYDALDGDFDQISAILFTPSGVAVFNSNADQDVGPFTLVEPGTYTLVIDGVGAT